MPEDRAASAPATDTVETARAKMLAAVRPLAPEPVDITAAIGRTLAETLQAARSQPPFRSSAMDGYGVRAAGLAQGPFTVLGEAQAGKAYPGIVGASGAVRVFTGAPVPEGVDLGVPQERARREGDRVWLRAPAPPRPNLRAAGHHLQTGEGQVPPGPTLHPR